MLLSYHYLTEKVTHMQIKYIERADGKGWLVDLRPIGQGRKTVRTEALAKELAERATKGMLGPQDIPSPEATDEKTVYDAFWHCHRVKYAGQKDDKTKYKFEHWINVLGPRTLVKDLKLGPIEDELVRLREMKLAESTLNKYTSYISTILRFCRSREWTTLAPEFDWMEPQQGGHRRRMTDAEEQLMYEMLLKRPPKMAANYWVNPAHRWVVQLLIWTGMRTDEALSLPWKDVDLDNNCIHLWPDRTKTGKYRKVPITPQALEALEALRRLTNGPYVYDFAYRTFKHHWDKAKRWMGLAHDKQFVPYCARHTCALRLVDAGVHASIIMNWLGHTNLETTMIYIGADETALTNAANLLGNRPAPSGVPLVCQEKSSVPNDNGTYAIVFDHEKASWRSGYAEDCKSLQGSTED